jgi:acyl transferase domain-containing protein
LDATELAQPALFAVGYASMQALFGLGIRPAAVIGHSLGEITAACVAGILELPDAARLVVTRGRAMQACPSGAMLAVGCEEKRAETLITTSGADLEIAAINHAESCVVAGTVDAISHFQRWLGDRIVARLLPSNRAFHSRLIREALPALASQLSELRLHPVRLPIACNLHGRLLTPGTRVDPEMFVDQAARPVRFADALAAIVAAFPGALAIEVGCGATLSAMARVAGLRAVPLSPRRDARDCARVLESLGTLWTMGYPVDPGMLSVGGERIHLPVYPFAGPHWIAPETTAGSPMPVQAPVAPARSSPLGLRDRPDRAEIPRVLLEQLWTELLGESNLSEDADFFELGGDSMLVTSLARRLEQEIGIRVPLREMLAGRTLGRQATILTHLLDRSPEPRDQKILSGQHANQPQAGGGA